MDSISKKTAALQEKKAELQAIAKKGQLSVKSKLKSGMHAWYPR